MRLSLMLTPASIRYFLWDNVPLRRSDFVACRTDRAEGEAPPLQIIPEASLGAFFECCGFAAQVGENFAGEMKRARDQNRIWLCACKRQRIANARSEGVGECWSHAGQYFYQRFGRGGAFAADFRGVNRSDRQSRILFLVLSSQRTLRSVVTFIQQLQRRIEFSGSGSNHFFRFGWLWGGNHRNSWLDNSRFLARNLSQRISKPF